MFTINEYINSLKQDKSTLVTNLTTKGVIASDSETFTTLVPKVLDISEGETQYTLTLDFNGALNEELEESLEYQLNENTNFYLGNITNDEWEMPEEGLIFAGWTTVRDDETTLVNNIIMEEDTTLYMLFKENDIPDLSDYFTETITSGSSSIPGGLKAIKSIPADTVVSGTSLSNTFKNFTSLETLPLIDLSNVTNLNSTFYNCQALSNIPLLNTSMVNTMQNTFQECYGLTEIPQLNTSRVSVMYGCFQNCINLETIPLLDFSTVNNIQYIFAGCSKLKNLGGFKDLGNNYSTSISALNSALGLDLSASTLLTHDSLMNVINNLYDIATKGCNTQALILGATNLAKLSSSEIAIATTKGWTVS